MDALALDLGRSASAGGDLIPKLAKLESQLRLVDRSRELLRSEDLYELAKILGHANIKMTERYAKLGRKHIARTSNTAREIWKLMEREEADKANVV